MAEYKLAYPQQPSAGGSNAFARGAQMALQAFQMQQGAQGQAVRSQYMQELMKGMQAKRGKETKQQEILGKITPEITGQLYPPDFAKMAAMLIQAGLMQPDIPTELDIYKARTARISPLKEIRKN